MRKGYSGGLKEEQRHGDRCLALEVSLSRLASGSGRANSPEEPERSRLGISFTSTCAGHIFRFRV